MQLFVNFVAIFLLMQTVMSIKNGITTDISKHPWQASINVKISLSFLTWWRDHICGAVIIGRNWILTAEHCFKKTNLHYEVRVGTAKTAWWGSIFEIKKRKPHPEYDFPFNDIAIIELKASIEFDDAIMPIKMAKSDYLIDSNFIVETTGFGAKCFRCDNSESLMVISLTTVSLLKCKEEYSYLTNRSICAIDTKQQSTSCEGDSGGPLVIRTVDEPVLIGLTRGGDNCSSSYPAIYSFIPAYRNWITNETGI